MIKQIKIKNFQSHADTHLQLDEGVNVLIGDSDSGKSAIFRALLWVFENEPRGDEFVSHWGGSTEVSVQLDDGRWVGRVKGTGKNLYYIDDQEYAIARGGAVPGVVVEALNLSSVNFQSQMDPAFLLSQTSGQVGRFLNKIADLDIIHHTEKSIAASARDAKAELEGAEEDVKTLTAQLESYDWLKDAEGAVAIMEEVDGMVAELETDIEWLEHHVADIDEIEGELETLTPVLEAEEEVKRVVGLEAETRRLKKERQGLQELSTHVALIDQDLALYMPFLSAEEAVSSLLEMGQGVGKAEAEIVKLKDLVGVINGNELSLNGVRGALAGLELKFQTLMPDECPLCGRSG